MFGIIFLNMLSVEWLIMNDKSLETAIDEDKKCPVVGMGEFVGNFWGYTFFDSLSKSQ